MSGKLSVSLHLLWRRLFFSKAEVGITLCPGDAHGGQTAGRLVMGQQGSGRPVGGGWLGQGKPDPQATPGTVTWILLCKEGCRSLVALVKPTWRRRRLAGVLLCK